MTLYEIEKIEKFIDIMRSTNYTEDNIKNSILETRFKTLSAASKNLQGEKKHEKFEFSDEELLNEIIYYCADRTLEEIILLFPPDSGRRKYIEEKKETIRKERDFHTDEMIKSGIAESVGNLTIKENFYFTLLGFINKNNYSKFSDFYHIIPLDRKEWYRITKGNIPNKRIVLIMLIILKTDFFEAEYLMNLAGYSFQKNNKTDLTILHLIKENCFKNMNAEEALIETDTILETIGEEPIYTIK